jgi:hypothetical protein
MSGTDAGAVVSPWTQDASGYLLTPSGVKAARLDRHGIIWLWDHKAKREYPLTPEDIRTHAARLPSTAQ